MSDTISGAGNKMANKIDKVPTLVELIFPARQKINKLTN